MDMAVHAWDGKEAFEDVLARTRTDDEVAFSALWRWAQPSLLRWQAVAAPAAGEDLASDVWILVIRGLDAFRGGEPEFRAWFFTIARRRAIDLARRRRCRPPTVQLDGVDSPDRSDLAGVVAGDAAVASAIRLLRRLQPAQAEVVALRVIAEPDSGGRSSRRTT